MQGRRRKLKSQGILKINNNCTSSITLTINKVEGNVQAIIYHTHYGHEAELVHLRIPKSDKQEIASKLLQGVKIEDILLSYKKDGLSKQIERKHLIKRRDILNISKKYNVNIILPKVRQPSKKKEIAQETNEPLFTKDSLQNMNETKKRHNIASQLPLSIVNPIYENIWRISMENNLVSTYSSNNLDEDVYHVTKNDVTHCGNDCKAYCNSCNICYHLYSCTCSDFLSKMIMCEHIHLVVFFQITPTFPCEENIVTPLYGIQDHTAYTQQFSESINLIQPIENLRSNEDISKNVDYKQNVKLENIKSTKIRLEKLMYEVIQKVGECNNSDLLVNVERQLNNISHNIGTDILQNKKRNNETQTIITPEKNVEVFYVFRS